jgi:hypothetical protein
MPLFPLLPIAILAFLIAYWASRKTRPAAAKTDAPRSEADAWVERMVAEAIAKSAGVAVGEALETLRGTPEPEVVTKIEAALRSVRVTYEKLAQGDIEARTEVALENGETTQRARKLTEADLPESIRAELKRTGAAFVVRDWHLPWR